MENSFFDIQKKLGCATLLLILSFAKYAFSEMNVILLPLNMSSSVMCSCRCEAGFPDDSRLPGYGICKTCDWTNGTCDEFEYQEGPTVVGPGQSNPCQHFQGQSCSGYHPSCNAQCQMGVSGRLSFCTPPDFDTIWCVNLI